ncbi:hypothetical protein EDB89DRAFT_2062888 [Lactarius sanguifluus]|nr:hypothetical protein EDB89DRAFT_2062888 [Lactarius sanguifluus]
MPGSPVADIRNSIGAAFIGLVVSTTLFGLTLGQTWIYFWHYRKRDPMTLKFFVAFIMCVVLLMFLLVQVAMFSSESWMPFDTILSAYAIYWYLVLNFGNVENLDYVMWAMNMEFAIGPEAIVCAFVQMLALRRFSLFHSLIWVMCAGVAAVAMTDLLIAAAMCWSLYRKRTGFARQVVLLIFMPSTQLTSTHRADSIITTLMAYSINSGLLTSILSLGVIISFVVSPSSMIWLAFLWVMGKCGANSLLAMLNSRDFIRERSDADDPDCAFTGRLSMIRFEPPASETYESTSGQTGDSVTVHNSTA